MQHISYMARACVLAAAFVFVPVVALAGSDGSFSGTVVDPSGSSVSGATVVARNERTGEERVVVANAEGRYVLTGLRPSVYTIKVTFQGFAPVEYTGVQLAAAQEFPLDLTLQAAGVTEAVTVRGNATAIDLSSARIGVNVTEREVQNLPVNGRQMSQLMLQAPGSQNAGTGTWNDVRFSGRANQQNVIKFDGVEGSAIIDASPGNIAGQIASPFKLQASLENVQEFRVESNNYPAEFGTGTGGQVSVVTKSGSNRVSGSLFEYLPQRQARRPELLRLDPQPRRQRHPGAAQVGAQPAPVRRLDRRAGAEEPRLLLRQLRGLPPRRRRQLRRSRAERGGVGRGPCRPSRRSVRASRRRTPCCCRARRPTRTSTSTSCRASRTSRRTRSARASTSG